MAYGQTYGWASKSSTIAIADNSASQYIDVNMSPNQAKELWRRTATVYHNSDGTRAFSLAASVDYTGITWNGGGLGNVWVGGNVTLDTIPRVSTLTMSTSKVFLDDTTVNFTINKAHSSFTHDLYWSYYNQNNPGFTWVEGQWGYLGNIKKSTATSASGIIPMTNKVLSLLHNTSTSWFYIYLDTFNGSTFVGRTWYKMDIEIPTRIKPTITITSLLESNTEAFNAMGNHEFVVSKSAPKMTATGAPGQYATLTQYEFRDADENYIATTSNAVTFSAPKKEKAEGEFRVRCQDSRGRWSDWALIKRKIHNWEPPKIELFHVYRDPTKQEEVLVNAKGFVSSLGGKNTANYWVDVRSGDEWSNKGGIAISGGTTTIDQTIKLIGNFDIGKGFSFRVNFRDKFGVSTSDFNITTAKVLLHYYKDEGIGIGKMRERGMLDVAGDVYINDAKIGGSSQIPAGNGSTKEYWHTFPDGQTSWFKPGQADIVGFPVDWGMVELTKYGNEFVVKAYELPNGLIYTARGNSYQMTAWELVFTEADDLPILWQGAAHMGEWDVITLESLSSCRNGWMLIWSYDNGSAQDYWWNIHYIPKALIYHLNGGNGGTSFPMGVDSNINTYKYLYITNTQLKGYPANTTGLMGGFVLRAVREW